MENLVASLMRLLLHIMVTKCLHGYLLSLFYHYYTMFTLLIKKKKTILCSHHNDYLHVRELASDMARSISDFPGFKIGF